MSIIYEERLSDSPYLETVTHGRTAGDGSVIRPAEIHWHMVLVRYNGNARLIVVGPLTKAGVVSFTEGAEILWIKFKLGIFMPHLPVRDFLDVETILPGAAGQSFWLKGSAWQFPDYDNVETFIDRLVREDVLVHDPVVEAVLQGHPPEMSSRTVRHRFLRATGLTQLHIYQAERARRAEALLQQGVPILDTVDEAGYFDQPHLTRALKKFVGYTPAQITHMRQPE
ncbi:MAG TPA: helix-turn-helix domain-containing protein [Anaerolineae bacterium]|nr:helix-turn-helix domain-containing protein [Anaerolineae bacterium]